MKKEFGEIALAGLLHDIGKFGRRAGETADGKADHAAVGDKFVRIYVPKIWQSVLAPVGWHHGDPEGRGHETFPVVAVRIADRLSAGEREKREDEDSTEKIPQMITPFSRLVSLCSGSRLGQNKPKWLPLTKLSLRPQNLSPSEQPFSQQELKRTYAELWQSFCKEAEELRRVHESAPDLASYLQSVLDLLLRYTWSVPSAFYYDLPDISLYDHSRITAALSVCIFAAFQGKEQEASELLERLRSDDPQR